MLKTPFFALLQQKGSFLSLMLKTPFFATTSFILFFNKQAGS
jgi:hypothetical protein